MLELAYKKRVQTDPAINVLRIVDINIFNSDHPKEVIERRRPLNNP